MSRIEVQFLADETAVAAAAVGLCATWLCRPNAVLGLATILEGRSIFLLDQAAASHLAAQAIRERS